jgi:uncharacterized cupin superfamily protein
MNPVAKANSPTAVILGDAPIPAELVTEGNPVGRIWISAQSEDLKVTQGVWDCTAGKFNWDFGWDEFVMILEGEAIITPREGGDAFTMRPGDFVNFPLGLKVEWHIPKYIKKTFVIRTPEPFKL